MKYLDPRLLDWVVSGLFLVGMLMLVLKLAGVLPGVSWTLILLPIWLPVVLVITILLACALVMVFIFLWPE